MRWTNSKDLICVAATIIGLVLVGSCGWWIGRNQTRPTPLPISSEIIDVLDRCIVDGHVTFTDAASLNDWLNSGHRLVPKRLNRIAGPTNVELPGSILLRLAGEESALPDADRLALLEWIVSTLDPQLVVAEDNAHARLFVWSNELAQSPVVWNLLREAALGKVLSKRQRRALIDSKDGPWSARSFNEDQYFVRRPRPFLGGVIPHRGSEGDFAPAPAAAPAPASEPRSRGATPPVKEVPPPPKQEAAPAPKA